MAKRSLGEGEGPDSAVRKNLMMMNNFGTQFPCPVTGPPLWSQDWRWGSEMSTG